MATNLGILGSEFFTNIILPFLLIFVVVFAILEKTKILGEKKDINAIVSLVFALIVIGVPSAVGVMFNIIPVIAVIIVILLSWMMTYGFVGGAVNPVTKAWQRFFQIVLGFVFLGIIVWATGLYKSILKQPWATQIGPTLLLIGSIAAVIAIVLSEKSEEAKTK